MFKPLRSRARYAAAALTLLLGVLLGVCVGDALAHRAERRSALADLDRYAERLMHVGEGMDAETNAAVRAALSDHLPFCSDADLAFLRNWVYNARHVRDIGRIKDNKLVCVSGIGRLDPPRESFTPDIQVDGMKVFANIPILISPGTRGFVVQRLGVSVVLNPAVYSGLDEPPMLFGGWMRVPKDGHTVLIRGFGHAMPLSDAEILAGNLLERDGIAYQPRCAPKARLCVVGSEPIAAMFAGTFTETLHFALVGGLLGGLLALVILLSVRRHRSLEAQLHRAIRRGEIRVEYQPVVELSSGRIVAAEALARWNDAAGMPISPVLFISIAEEKGFVWELTRLVAARAIRELGDLLRNGNFRVTLNIAPEDLESRSFDQFLAHRLADERVPAAAFGLEITERSTANHATALAAIERLKAAGHAVFIDDFGTGYSSLAYLHDMAVDGIKIDRNFTQTVGTEAVTASVVPQILSIARQLGLVVVVEGIETRQQAQYFEGAIGGLAVLGQGFFLGSPMTAAALREKLR